MRIFPHPNLTTTFLCPICRKSDDKPIVLIGIAGSEDGFNIQAKQVHVDCLDNLRIIKDTAVETIIAVVMRRNS